MISCPNCGGNLKFDIPSQNLTCEYCHEFFDPYKFDSKTSDAEESKAFENDYEVTIFTCPQCGGEILSTDNAAAGFCSFCGASTILYSRISHEHRPNFIIPFQKSKDDCKQAYMDLMKHAIFAPKELKDSKYIDSFRGIYMPYWAYYITQKGPLQLNGKKSHRSGDYIITDHFNLTGEIDSYYKGISYDASSSFADNISEGLAPYDLKGMKAFTPGYFSGFYADTADVDSKVYQPDAENTAYKQSVEQLKKVPAFAGYSIENTSPSQMNTLTENVDTAMFPVWFMSYRKNDRVAYVTVNGQTGKVVADVPIDPKKYVLGSLLLAIPIFIVLALFLTMLPTNLMTVSGLLVLITSIICTSEIFSIAKKDSLADDRGWLSKHPVQGDFSKPKADSSKTVAKIVSLCVLAMILFSVLPVFGSMIVNSIGGISVLAWICFAVVFLITLAIGVGKLNKMSQKLSVLGYIVSTIAMVAGTAIALLNPVYDYFYYGGTILAMAAVLLSISDVIRYYNILSTRKLPQFDKKGGDDRA